MNFFRASRKRKLIEKVPCGVRLRLSETFIGVCSERCSCSAIICKRPHDPVERIFTGNHLAPHKLAGLGHAHATHDNDDGKHTATWIWLYEDDSTPTINKRWPHVDNNMTALGSLRQNEDHGTTTMTWIRCKDYETMTMVDWKLRCVDNGIKTMWWWRFDAADVSPIPIPECFWWYHDNCRKTLAWRRELWSWNEHNGIMKIPWRCWNNYHWMTVTVSRQRYDEAGMARIVWQL